MAQSLKIKEEMEAKGGECLKTKAERSARSAAAPTSQRKTRDEMQAPEGKRDPNPDPAPAVKAAGSAGALVKERPCKRTRFFKKRKIFVALPRSNLLKNTL